MNVTVGRGEGVEEAAGGCGSGKNRVGKINSEVGVEYVPQSEGVWPQEFNKRVAMKITGMKRLTGYP